MEIVHIDKDYNSNLNLKNQMIKQLKKDEIIAEENLLAEVEFPIVRMLIKSKKPKVIFLFILVNICWQRLQSWFQLEKSNGTTKKGWNHCIGKTISWNWVSHI